MCHGPFLGMLVAARGLHTCETHMPCCALALRSTQTRETAETLDLHHGSRPAKCFQEHGCRAAVDLHSQPQTSIPRPNPAGRFPQRGSSSAHRTWQAAERPALGTILSAPVFGPGGAAIPAGTGVRKTAAGLVSERSTSGAGRCRANQPGLPLCSKQLTARAQQLHVLT